MRRQLVLLVVLSLVAIACGPHTASNASISSAGSLAEKQGSFRMTSSGSSELPEEAGGGLIEFESDGVIDAKSKLGSATFTFSGESGQAQALGSSMGAMEAIYDFSGGFIIYMKWPFLTRQIPTAKDWIKMDLQKIGEEMGLDLGAMMQAGQNDPMQGLDYLKGAQDVEEVGTETVRDVATTHYRATVDFDLLAEEAPGMADSIAKLKGLSGLEEIPMEVWLDEEGLPRRVSYAFNYNPPEDAPAGTPSGRTELTNDFYDYGIDVNVELPSPEETTDLYELLREGT